MMLREDQMLALISALTVAAVVYCVSVIFHRVSSWLAFRCNAIDAPTGGRKIHRKPTPLFGGLGIAAAMFLVIGAMYWMDGSWSPLSPAFRPYVIGWGVGVLMLLIGGLWDDARPLKPSQQIVFPLLASAAVLASGVRVVHMTNPFTHAAFVLPEAVSFALTIAWLLVATYAMKILDGLDGLVTGLTVIGAAMIGAFGLSIVFFQPQVVLLCAVVFGAYLGFLPRNIHPATQFLGESGATIAGFSLGVLAILGSAKIAISLTALGIPIADVAFVVIGRMRRGQPWFKGDDSHLHFRLLRAGVPYRWAVAVYWLLALTAGIFALTMQTRGKIAIIAVLIILAFAASLRLGTRSRGQT